MMVDLYNDCFDSGMFSRPWKRGLFKVSYKENGKESSLVKSYRPLTMFPEVTEVLHIRQCGFRQGKGKEVAVLDLVDHIKSSTEPYVMAVSLDISGAFDSAWWTYIL
ncbi:hypothetical protein PR048_017836 [Dryococelus australis]|uniref:Reverse transcriptase domain-containing protein n=1 Tax=Dryococelus australis TaxID=614101 RepID=A0ABQ9HAN4_9NEOP|nr:hypothetical protein PR048_017836 [Dryococelus australis]